MLQLIFLQKAIQAQVHTFRLKKTFVFSKVLHLGVLAHPQEMIKHRKELATFHLQIPTGLCLPKQKIELPLMLLDPVNVAILEPATKILPRVFTPLNKPRQDLCMLLG
jgi:hypothetical protein